MSDHADVIREALNYVEAGEPVRYERGVDALDALVAERDEAVNARLDSLMRDEMSWRERAEAAEAEVARLRGEIEDYMLWEPGRAGHAAAHERLRAALAAPTKEDTDE